MATLAIIVVGLMLVSLFFYLAKIA